MRAGRHGTTKSRSVQRGFSAGARRAVPVIDMVDPDQLVTIEVGDGALVADDLKDELGRELGIDRADDEEFRASGEILRLRDRFRWHLEHDAEDEAQGHPHRRRGSV